MPNFGGMSITLPHKVPIMEFCDEIGQQGKLVGAVNYLAFDKDRRLIADNCDGSGFVSGLLAAGHEIAQRRILMVGAGGRESNSFFFSRFWHISFEHCK